MSRVFSGDGLYSLADDGISATRGGGTGGFEPAAAEVLAKPGLP
jgi:hypothetical protein